MNKKATSIGMGIVIILAFLAACTAIPTAIPQPQEPTPVAVTDGQGEVSTYTVQAGDTLFGIAERFGLQPETIVWSNRDANLLIGAAEGQVLVIPPADGVVVTWRGKDQLAQMAQELGVSLETVTAHPANQALFSAGADPLQVDIPAGTRVFFPGGQYTPDGTPFPGTQVP